MGSDFIAVDVEVFGEAHFNKASRSSQKIFIPPVYKEGYNMSRDAIYDITIGSGQAPNKSAASQMIRKAKTAMMKNKDMILRAIQKQQADFLQTGVITVKNGDNVNYNREAASMPSLGAGARWNEGTSTPLADLQAGGKYLREEALSTSSEFNVIMGGDAFAAFMNHDDVTKQAQWTNIRRENIDMPQLDKVTGMTFQGQIGTNDFRMNIWTYSEGYTTTLGGARTYYLDPKNYVMLPDDFRAKTIFGAVPGMTGSGDEAMPTAVEATFYPYSYLDKEAMARFIYLTSAPLVVPMTPKKVYSSTVLA
jgi:hypothetical protein